MKKKPIKKKCLLDIKIAETKRVMKQLSNEMADEEDYKFYFTLIEQMNEQGLKLLDLLTQRYKYRTVKSMRKEYEALMIKYMSKGW